MRGHLFQYFTSDNTFFTKSDFKEEKFERTLQFDFNQSKIIWDGTNVSNEHALGDQFAILRN